MVSSKIGKVFLFLLIIALIAATTYFFIQYRAEKANNPANEVAKIVKLVSKHMELPDEAPTLATVTDKEKLSEQNFFKQAENGDKVLIYLQAGKAILYRPSIGKIIDVTKVNRSSLEKTVSDQSPEPTSAPTSAPKQEAEAKITPEPTAKPLTVTLLNGTATPGITQAIEEIVQENSENFSVVVKKEAIVREYGNSIVVDVSGKNVSQALKLAQLLGVNVDALPESEEAPSTDLVVIVGADLAQ